MTTGKWPANAMFVNDPRRSFDTVTVDGLEPRAIDAALTSVAAHGMLNSLGVAKATISTIRLHWNRIDDETCLRLLLRAEAQLTFLGDTLGDLVRGIPAETRELLEALPDARLASIPQDPDTPADQ